MAYSKYGNGDIRVIMIHGWGLTHKLWCRLVSEMDNGTYSFYSVDLVGFGDSDKSRDQYNIDSWSRDIIEFAEIIGIREPIIFGHSLGASVTLNTLILHTLNARAAVIFDSGCKSAGNVKHLIESIENGVTRAEVRNLISSFFGSIRADDLDEFTNKALKMGHRTMVSTLNAISSFDLTDLIGTIDIPTLVFYGDRDRNRDIREVEGLASLLPRGFLRIVSGSGHCPMYEKPLEVALTLTDFIKMRL